MPPAPDAPRAPSLEPGAGAERARLEASILEILAGNPGGLSEMQLLDALAGRGLRRFGRAACHDVVDLFGAHFELFHVLYDLRDRLRDEGRAELTIGCLRIAAESPVPAPGSASARTPAIPDPLRAYYGNLDNLRRTRRADVEAMLGGFWRTFAAAPQRERAGALATLGLEPGASADAIKRRHRELVFEHHPDRGGDPARLRAVNDAIEVLRRSRGQHRA